MGERVLGLDIGESSVGFALLEISEESSKKSDKESSQIAFKILEANSITFDPYTLAKDRRLFRSSRRNHDRSSRRRENVRKLLSYFDLAPRDIIENPSDYFNALTATFGEPYTLRAQAVGGEALSKDAFSYALYTIITRRGYSNRFATAESDKEVKEKERVNSAIALNQALYEEHRYPLPSQVLTHKREEARQEGFINVAIRNKKGDYSHSLNRDLWREELEKLLESQKDNRTLFPTLAHYEEFKTKLLNGINEESLGVFEQRELQSFEGMVGYCTFYNAYHPDKQKRAIGAHVEAIEFVLRQKIDNLTSAKMIVDKKSGEILIPSQAEIEAVLEAWLKEPSAKIITTKNLLKPLKGNFSVRLGELGDESIQDISIHKGLVEILGWERLTRDGEFYAKMLEILHYFAAKDQKQEKLEALNDSTGILTPQEIELIASLDTSKRSYKAFSLKFIGEILAKMRQGTPYHETLEQLGYFSRYTQMQPYTSLPPLNPSESDLAQFPQEQRRELYYQAVVSPAVRRAIGIVRRLVNELLKRHGRIDKIVVETARELNSKSEKENLDKIQKENKKHNERAKEQIEQRGKKASKKNIVRFRLWEDQKGQCFYSGNAITLDEALDEKATEIEHFIPRSVLWVDAYKNKVLVLTKANQDKASQNPITFLGANWENFVGRVRSSGFSEAKKEWLTNVDQINGFFDESRQEELEGRYLNDTRAASKIVARYLEHYLYPKKEAHGKGEKPKVLRVNGKAVAELKHLWGVHEAQPLDEKGQKDRNTHYHHTVDAIMIALVNEASIKKLHEYFLHKESKKPFDSKERFPIQKESEKPIATVIKELVEAYEKNQRYVCHYGKKKMNKRGFKDGNLKLIWDEELKGFYEISHEEISPAALLCDKNGKPFANEQIEEKFETLKAKLELPKQQHIKEALEQYETRLLATKKELENITEAISIEKSKLPRDKKIKNDETEAIYQSLDSLYEKQKEIIHRQNIPCHFLTKKGQKQAIRNLHFRSEKATDNAIILITDKRYKNRAKRLSKEVYDELKAKKIPFVVKRNDATLSIDLYNTPEGQVVGLNYFSSIKNEIAPEISQKKIKFIKDYQDKIVISENDIVEVNEKGDKKLYRVNGGGNVSGGGNKFEVKPLNNRGEKRVFITPQKQTTIKLAKLNFFGEVSYEE